MPTPVPAGLRLGLVEPTDAIAAFQRRGLLQPSFAWQDVWQDEHARAFAVAGVQRLDVLQVFQAAVDDAIRSGTSLAEFRKTLIPQLTAKGFWGDVEVEDPATGERRISRFNPRRLQLIYDVNMRQSFAAGRWARAQRSKARLPYLVYLTMQDERVRASHRRWNALVLPVDHPFWDTHYPPNGWMCRCYAYAIDDKGVERLRRAGVKIQTEAPAIDWITHVNPRTGEVAPVPRGIDPGFAYNPGKGRDPALHEAALRKALVASPLAGAVAVAQAQADFPAFVASATNRFGPFVDRALRESYQARGEVRFIGALPPAAVRAMADQGLQPATAAVAVRDVDVLHALRPGKAGTAAAISASVYRRLPELLARAQAMLLEPGAEPPAVLYVVDLLTDSGTVAKLVVQVDIPVQVAALGQRRQVPVNLVRSAVLMDAAALRDRGRFRLLWGAL
jgi:SPP1 gp7 family putative phage head morphogenesis protein